MNNYGIPQDAVITIAGTVGVGKSTLTKALAERFNFRTSFENVDHNPYLDKFYNDFERWSFHLQIYFLAERFKEQKRMFEYGGGFIQDRSIYEDVDIFAKMHQEQGTMSPEDFETYSELFNAMVMTPYFPKPDVLIYLECDYDDVINRIQQRGRQMEIETDTAYWQKLYQRYEDWISEFNACPVVRVNINEYDLHEDPETLNPVIDKIRNVIETYRKVDQR
ncbi:MULTISPECIES: deoxynucleoside kinase [Staphylococcus]|uniref:Putative deoxyadenosine kinase n=1 Tax=Staphylococcus saprophyticus subsp. saprophyticus (strain ATCC 15305 / DSM 20229 / NCIMB 8711 / NCTC 7292 / S-41) TaxID=342451 RepID=Q49VA7_STAS1|nr:MULTISPECIES: deoxynucleoside kinase [Staphylococcus]ASE57895.1 deoxynucleoside kinase [Staphylococcus saprophyticus]ASF18930.1 deoxynucleoside kinase [Staphylococcus saprophyticus]MBN6756409.1 deoxynucleoside kinase [Staphylococcus saprophyticus]MBN6766388.1 deoxynucleoside kinase [Staphylococcus saprophyticus]MBN6770712.1 deoxynucleoside kinase [Staphylococcus saprophyticus]